MATMYVYNIPTNETVNLRKTASTSGTVLVKVGYGKAVEASASSTTGWHNATYSGYTGFIMSQYLTSTNPNGSSGSYNYTITATVDTVKNGVGGTVNLRKEASTSSSVVTTIGDGKQVLVSTLSGEWLPAKYGTYTGFIMGKYIVGADAYGGSSSGGSTTTYSITAMVETDRYGNGGTVTMRSGQSTGSSSVTTIGSGNTVYVSTLAGEWLPAKYGNYTGYIMAKFIFNSNVYKQKDSDATISIAYNRTNAVNYAKTYALNYNTSQYNTIANNDCANFVSQCLYAGGMYMNSTWNYKKPGAYTSRTTAWTGTVSLRNMLTDRKWAYRVYDKAKLKRGDLVYTYESDTSLPHVVIVSQDVGSDGKIYICGHTSNQNDVPRDASIKSIYYHIEDTLWTKSSDWRY